MLVIRQSKSTQAEVMIENISSSLENRINQGFSEEERTTLEANGLIDPDTKYPLGDGGVDSSENLYAVLSGDYTLSGIVDDDRQPMFPQVDPQYSGKGQYLIRQSSDQLENGRDTTKLKLVDPWGNQLRYAYDTTGTLQLNNNVENGFDIWSVGPDGVDTGLNADGEDGELDNITNW